MFLVPAFHAVLPLAIAEVAVQTESCHLHGFLARLFADVFAMHTGKDHSYAAALHDDLHALAGCCSMPTVHRTCWCVDSALPILREVFWEMELLWLFIDWVCAVPQHACVELLSWVTCMAA